MKLSKLDDTVNFQSKKASNAQKYKCVIIGSFRKYYPHILKIIELFRKNGIEVLSPRKSYIINPEDEFVLFDYNPKDASEKDIENLVLEKMHKADFVYLVNPEGYVGLSASFEVGYCTAHNIKVIAMERSNELCAKYLFEVKKPEEVIENVREIIVEL